MQRIFSISCVVTGGAVWLISVVQVVSLYVRSVFVAAFFHFAGAIF